MPLEAKLALPAGPSQSEAVAVFSAFGQPVTAVVSLKYIGIIPF